MEEEGRRGEGRGWKKREGEEREEGKRREEWRGLSRRTGTEVAQNFHEPNKHDDIIYDNNNYLNLESI